MPRPANISITINLEQLLNDITDDDLYLILDELSENEIRKYCSDRYNWVVEDEKEE